MKVEELLAYYEQLSASQ